MARPPDVPGKNAAPAATARGQRSSSSSMSPIGNHLRRPKGRLAQLIAQTDRLSHINKVFLAYLPNHLHGHAKITSTSADYWLVQTDSSAWASRLRYLLPQLQQQLSEQFGNSVPPLKLRVQPPAGDIDSASAAQRRMEMTEKSAALLTGAAQDVSDQKLGAALRRLAGNAARQRA